jgi:enoyl-CoA hydratase/carnithine racemase
MIEWATYEGVAELRLEHGPLNEIGTVVLSGLERFVEAVEHERPRAVIVYSGLPRGFCAGADLRELHAAIAGRSPDAYLGDLARTLDRIHALMNRLDALPVTTVGAIHGVCFGGGFELALTLDVLVADTTARFCLPELRLGIIPGFGAIPRLEREVGNAVVRDLIFTGRSFNAKKACELGLVSQVVARGEALTVARQVAAQAARFEPRVQAAAKRFIKRVPEQALAQEKALFLELFCEPRVVEALRRFVGSEDAMPYLPGERA